MNRLETMNTNQNIAFIRKVDIFIDNRNIVDKDIHASAIFISESNLARASKKLLEDKTGNNWISQQPVKPMYGDGVHQRYMFRDLDGRHGMVVLGYIPIPMDEFESQRGEIVDRIDVNLLD